MSAGTDHYFHAGDVERTDRTRRYRRLPGYSLLDPQSGNACQPWATFTEARAGSKAAGRDPIFHPDEATARRSIACEQQEGRP